MNCRHLRLSLYVGFAIRRNVNKITRRQRVTCHNNLIFNNTSLKTSNLALFNINEEGDMNKLVKGTDSLQYHWYNEKRCIIGYCIIQKYVESSVCYCVPLLLRKV
jgi:hypothetical protein